LILAVAPFLSVKVSFAIPTTKLTHLQSVIRALAQEEEKESMVGELTFEAIASATGYEIAPGL
jgi:hypothetical protein